VGPGTNESRYQSKNKNNSLNTTKQEIYDFQLQIDCNNNRETKEPSNHNNIYGKDNDHEYDNHRRTNHHDRSPGVSSDNIIIIPKTNSPKVDNNNNNNNNNDNKNISKYDNITYISSKVRKNKTSAADRQTEAKDQSIWFTATPWQQQFNAPTKPSRPQLHAYF
jgi:hypothetical protein